MSARDEVAVLVFGLGVGIAVGATAIGTIEVGAWLYHSVHPSAAFCFAITAGLLLAAAGLIVGDPMEAIGE